MTFPHNCSTSAKTIADDRRVDSTRVDAWDPDNYKRVVSGRSPCWRSTGVDAHSHRWTHRRFVPWGFPSGTRSTSTSMRWSSVNSLYASPSTSTSTPLVNQLNDC